jgi:hypothetical protein
MFKVSISLILAIAVAAPAIAGEVTGSGKDIDIRARSECAYSGLNDNAPNTPDPGGFTQSYGTNVGQFGIINPQDLDPNADVPFVPIPGFACNPNRYHDLHD